MKRYKGVKYFLKQEASKGKYEGVTVEWKSGAYPTAFFYDIRGNEVGKRNSDGITIFFCSHSFYLPLLFSLSCPPLFISSFLGQQR